jgi:hypothetical protein
LHPGATDVPGNGINEDCSADGPAVRRLGKPRASFAGGGAIAINGRPAYFAASALQLSDLTRGSRVVVSVCHGGCRPTRFTAKGGSKKIWLSRRHRQVRLTGGRIDVKVYMPRKADVAGSYLRLKLTKRRAAQCGGALVNGGSKVSGRGCRPR